MAPYLRLDDVVGGTFCPRDGYADPYSVAMGFAKQARRLGVRICEETEALDIKVSKEKVRAVVTNQGEIATPVVVNAAGPWAAQVGDMAALELPVVPYRRQVFVTAPFDELPRQIPLIIDFAPSFYFRREGASILIGDGAGNFEHQDEIEVAYGAYAVAAADFDRRILDWTIQ